MTSVTKRHLRTPEVKAHALRSRGENKDAYDLVYVLMAHGGGSTDEVVERFVAITGHQAAQEALELLAEDFESPDHVGPPRAAEFRTRRHDPAIQANASGYVQDFLRRVAMR